MGSSIGSNTPPRPREECFSGVKDGCFLVRWLRIHCFINLFRTICRPLTKKEFFNTTSDLVPEHNYTRFCELRSKHPVKTVSFRTMASVEQSFNDNFYWRCFGPASSRWWRLGWATRDLFSSNTLSASSAKRNPRKMKKVEHTCSRRCGSSLICSAFSSTSRHSGTPFQWPRRSSRSSTWSCTTK